MRRVSSVSEAAGVDVGVDAGVLKRDVAVGDGASAADALTRRLGGGGVGSAAGAGVADAV